jgi:small-conductance mechanosensitive channel/predicted  nucleic acid-binding Zn-ribbon protein
VANRAISLSLLLLILHAAAALAQEPTGSSEATTRSAGPGATREPVEPPAQPTSDAEKIARLQRTIDESRTQLDALRSKLDDPDSEYANAQAEFTALDGEFERKKKDLQNLREGGSKEPVTALETEVQELEAQWKLAKDRFDLAIKERKALQQQLAALEQKIQKDTDALKRLRGEPEPAASTQPTVAPAAEVAPPPPEPVAPAAVPVTAARPRAQPSTEAPIAPAGATAPPATAPETPAVPPGAVGGPTQPAGKPAAPPSKELVKARQHATQKQAEAQEAQQEAKSITERIAALHKNIDVEQRLLETARQQADNAQETERTLYDELQRKWEEDSPQTELREVRQKIAESRQRLSAARTEIRARTDRIDQLQSELSTLQADQIAALQAAEKKQAEAETARKKVAALESPLSPQNLLRWGVLHGPRILGIIVGMVVILWVSRLVEKRVVVLVTRRGEQGTMAERENRAKTLLGVFHNAVRVAVIPAGILMVIAELGVNIVPLLGGAAVAGLAVAFGAQNLIRDYFTGFMILLENQYGVNDVVKIADTSGLVERVTLRMTVLRDLEGIVHFIPNGHITTVSNLTHGWSRALFDIGVAYKEDVDRVMQELVELAKALRRDPNFRGLILESPEMLGVDQFGDSAVVIKFFIKTKPMMQWTVKREMLRRIKKRFDELGIEIPFPHRTVYYRHEEGDGGPPRTFGAQPDQNSSPPC